MSVLAVSTYYVESEYVVAEVGTGSGWVGDIAGQVVGFEVDDDFAVEVGSASHIYCHFRWDRLSACIFGIRRSSETTIATLDLA